jgi:hypothetical protein
MRGKMLWLRSDFARVEACRDRDALAAERFARVWWLAEIVCGVSCPGCEAARIWSKSKLKEQAVDPIRSRATAVKTAGLIEIGVRENKPSIKLVFYLLIARFMLVSGEISIKCVM